MKILVSLVLSLGLLAGFISTADADDWGIAGKVLTGIVGTRILTGGKVDLVGALTGTANDYDRPKYNSQSRRFPDNSDRIWVPQYTWKKKWIPEHKEYDSKLGEIIVGGHYLQYKVQSGGHWEYARKQRDRKVSYR